MANNVYIAAHPALEGCTGSLFPSPFVPIALCSHFPYVPIAIRVFNLRFHLLFPFNNLSPKFVNAFPLILFSHHKHTFFFLLSSKQ
jgi:hypothetical protein